MDCLEELYRCLGEHLLDNLKRQNLRPAVFREVVARLDQIAPSNIALPEPSTSAGGGSRNRCVGKQATRTSGRDLGSRIHSAGAVLSRFMASRAPLSHANPMHGHDPRVILLCISLFRPPFTRSGGRRRPPHLERTRRPAEAPGSLLRKRKAPPRPLSSSALPPRAQPPPSDPRADTQAASQRPRTPVPSALRRRCLWLPSGTWPLRSSRSRRRCLRSSPSGPSACRPWRVSRASQRATRG